MANLEGRELTGKSENNHWMVLTGKFHDWSVQATSYQSAFLELQLEGAIATVTPGPSTPTRYAL